MQSRVLSVGWRTYTRRGTLTLMEVLKTALVSMGVGFAVYLAVLAVAGSEPWPSPILGIAGTLAYWGGYFVEKYRKAGDP